MKKIISLVSSSMSYNSTIKNCYGSIEVLKNGDGNNLVFIHGEEGPRDCLPYHDHLSKSFSIWAPSLPGTGGSQLPEWVNSVSDISKVLLETLDKEKITTCIIVGCSLGGWIASEMVSMDPSRFSGLVLCGSQGLPTGHLDTPDIFLTPYRNYIALGYRKTDNHEFTNLWKKEPDDKEIETDLEIMELTARIAFKPYMYDRSLLPSLSRYAKPSLLIWGDNDIITPISIAEQFNSVLNNSKITIVKNAGHYVHLEMPKDFSNAINDFSKKILR